MRVHALVLCLAGLLLLTMPAAAWSAPAEAAQVPDALSDEARISMVTVLPGDAAYSIFGHSALRVYDPAQGVDWMFNYGTFDFTDPLFLPKFAYGQLDYFLSVASFPRARRAYAEGEQRPVIEQVLNLSPAQRQALFDFLRHNAQPENRVYRYDFFYDNCSTRIRDALREALGEAVRFAPEPDPGQSFRHLLDPHLTEHPHVDLGIDLLLGTPADRVATPHQAHFLPILLMEAFDHASVEVDGQWQPLVARTDTTVWVADYALSRAALPWPTLLLWLFFAAGLALTIHDLRQGRSERCWFDGALFGLVGLAGLLILFMSTLTEHLVTRPNWNLLWAWPTHLLVALPLARRHRARWLRRYLLVTAAVALLTLAGWPLWPQPLPLAVLPLLLLLVLRSGVWVFVPREEPRAVVS